LVTSVERRMSKAGNPWAKIALEDLDGSIEVLFFGETYVSYSTTLVADSVLTIRGRVRRREESTELQAVEVSVPDTAAVDDRPVTIAMPVTRCTPAVVEKLREILAEHPGVTDVHLRLTESGGSTVMRLEDGLRIERSPALYGDLKALLGPGCLT
jgi:DNA polymerase III subunit alpha